MRRERRTAHVAPAILTSAALVLVACRSGGGSRSSPPAKTSASSTARPATSEIVAAPLAVPSAAVGTSGDACARLPFLSVYRRAGAILERTPNRVRLKLRVDLHAADCGAPDAYGHDMDVTLELRSVGSRCEVVRADSRSTPFTALESEKPPPAWTDAFLPAAPADLADPALEALTLEDARTQRALVLLGDTYFSYEDVKPGAPLQRKLAGENDEGCCYGATGAVTSHWHFEYFRSPFAGELIGEPDADALASFNRWATESELRDDLGRLVQRGFEPTKKARMETAFSRGEPPEEASVTVTDVWHHDPSKRAHGPHRRTLRLRFSRKACAECPSHMTPWWLWSANDTVECAGTDGGFYEIPGLCP